MASVKGVVEKARDSIYDRFVGYILSKIEVMDKPGYIVTRYTDSGEEVFLRELLLPEELFADIETRIREKFGRRGEQALYSIGKKFGYRYVLASAFGNAKTLSNKEMSKRIKDVVKYMEVVYADSIKHRVNPEKKYFEMTMKNFVICRLNGIGHILPEGAAAGVMSYIFCDNQIDAKQVECQRRGASSCKVVCGPPDSVKADFKEADLSGLELGAIYREMNEFRGCNYAKSSFKDLVDGGFYKYSAGRVMFGGSRYFGAEASMMYLLESGLAQIPGASKVLFDACHAFGKKVAKENSDNDYRQFITDYLSSLGWGDVFVRDESFVSSNYMPWTEFADQIDFDLFRGLVSGLLSGFLGKEVVLTKAERTDFEGHLNVTLQ